MMTTVDAARQVLKVGFAPRHVAVDGGHTLVVREVRPEDADGLRALFEGLDDDDRTRRFFNAYRPNRGWFERMTTVSARDGFRLVAELASGDEHHIVGEAGYSMLLNGDGELGVTVAQGQRGWLGPYLLDALVEAAAARGVPNLEADILVTNRPMLALVKARGYATMAHPDFTVVRVMIGAAARRPSWPGPHDRPRVLVEGWGGRWRAEECARAAGMQVLVCPGPLSAQRRCPALAGEPCPLASGADVIVLGLRPDDEPGRSLLDAHLQQHAGIPVAIHAAHSTGALPAGVDRVPDDADEPAAVALVQRLADEHRKRGRLDG